MLYDCLEYIIHHGIIANCLTGIKSENYHAGQTINAIFPYSEGETDRSVPSPA